MLSRRRKDAFRDIVHPLSSGTSTEIEDRIIAEYEVTASEAMSAEEALEGADNSYEREQT